MEKLDNKKANNSGKIASIVGILVNVLLSAGKIAVGSIFGLISVVADGFNNLTDCGSSIVSFVSFKLSSKPADEEHPFGHERIEYVCSLSVAFLVLMVAFDMVRESIGKIIAPTEIVFSVWVVAVLVFSILAKFGLFIYYKLTAKKINSTILSAAAVDSVSDCFATFITLLTFIIGTLSGVNIDGYAGIGVSFFIAWSAIGLLKGIFSNLIGKAPDKNMINDIRKRILSFDGVLGVHDLSVYCYGPNKFFASVHVEVSASIDVLVSHELVDLIERDFAENTNIVLTGHLDPIETDNPVVNELKEVVENIVLRIDQRFSIHDFRIVQGEKQTNVLFDLSIPYETAMNKNAIKERVEKEIKEYDKKFNSIITIEYGASVN